MILKIIFIEREKKNRTIKKNKNIFKIFLNKQI